MLNPSKLRIRPASGFTLIEMAIAMAIFGFLLAAALPSVGTWIDNTRIRGVAESIQNGIQSARAEAIRRNQSVTFYLVGLDNPAVMDDSCQLSGNSGSWVVSATPPNGHCSNAPSTDTAPMIVTKRAVGDSGAQVSVTATQSVASGGAAGHTITFNGFGRVTNADSISQIEVTGTAAGPEYRLLRIEISPAGMTRMCDPRVTAVDDPRIC